MKNWKDALIAPDISLREALKAIDRTGAQAVVVVDEQRRLLGTLTDGDVRRQLLAGVGLEAPVTRAMHADPTCAAATDSREDILARMRRTGLHQLPVIDAQRVVVGFALINDYLAAGHRDNWVIIMAGGLGTRLEQLTRDTPKPMLRVGSRPLLETIVRSYADQGFRRFYLAVNYKADQIEAHFGNGEALGVDIRYLREDQRLGTAGALSLLPQAPTEPLVVTNADLLTKEDYGAMVDQHVRSGADATMGVRPYEMQVPFGVVREAAGRIVGIEEKPTKQFTVSAGIYVLSPAVLPLVPAGRFFDMPSLFEAAMGSGLHARCHHILGYWMDIGRMADYERANLEFQEVFR